jgi:hypothetical protein
MSCNIDFIEKLVGIARTIMVFRHPNEIDAFVKRDDLFELVPRSRMGQAFLSGWKASSPHPLSHAMARLIANSE